MLVLSRRPKQQIVIGDNVVIEVREIRRDRVRIAIRAPKDVPVWRKEVWDKRQKDKEPVE